MTRKVTRFLRSPDGKHILTIGDDAKIKNGHAQYESEYDCSKINVKLPGWAKKQLESPPSKKEKERLKKYNEKYYNK